MRYRNLGNSGLKVSELALGAWFREDLSYDKNSINRLLGEALEQGVNLIDLADIYGQGETESLYGEVLKDYPRHQLVISSKCFWPMSEGANDRGLSRKHIMESVHASLKRLQSDYLDLYLCHAEDQETPLEETVRAMADLIRCGDILYWGVCSWRQHSLFELIQLCDQLNAPRPICHQIPYNLIESYPERELLNTSARLGLGVQAWSPFAGGVLARGLKQNLNSTQAQSNSTLDALWRLQANEKKSLEEYQRSFEAYAAEASMSCAQLALAWILRREEVSSIILGVSSLEQLVDNLKGLQRTVSPRILDGLSELFNN